MALPKRDKKQTVKVPVCSFCGAVGQHYSWQCSKNPKNRCKYCGSLGHTSIMCQKKPRRPIKKESDKALSMRTATTREWFKLNPPDPKGVWICYLQISPHCLIKLTRSTVRLEHVKSKARYPHLKYELSNIKPACDFCNKLKGSFDLEDLPKVSSIRLPEGRKWEDVLYASV